MSPTCGGRATVPGPGLFAVDAWAGDGGLGTVDLPPTGRMCCIVLPDSRVTDKTVSLGPLVPHGISLTS